MMVSDFEPADSTPEHRQPQPRRPFQFGLAALFVVTTLFSVLAAALGGMLRSRWGTSPMPPGTFELMAAAAPVAVVIVASMTLSLARWKKRRRR